MSDKAPDAKKSTNANPAPAKPAASAPAAPAAPPSSDVTLTIDGRSVTVPKGTLVVDAAQKLDIEIPVFCSHPKLDPVACCRMCLVEISGPRGPILQTACSVPVAQDMVVNTESEPVKSMQEMNLAFLLVNHPLDCPICDKGGECPLQDQTLRYGSGVSQLVEAKRRKKKHYLISDTIVLDQERCILCWRCIRYLEEWEDKPQLGLFKRGVETIIDVQDGTPVDAKTSGSIIDLCPVGALTNRVARFTYRPWEIDRTPSVCIHCSVGCNIRMDSRTHAVRRILGRENMSVNDQWICDKGRFAHGWINHAERLTTPLVRKNGELVTATWSEALETVAKRLLEIRKQNGSEAIGAIGSAKLGNESNYLLQRLFRQMLGVNNLDHRDGAAVSAIPAGLPALADLMKPQYGPDPKADVVVLVGVDPSEELPILSLHLKRAVRRGNTQLVIVHPRAVELTRYGGPHLAPRPGTEALLIQGLTRLALASAPSKVAGTAELATDASDEALRNVCGIDPAEAQRASALIAGARHAVILYGPMVARGKSGRAVSAALSNLAAVTGHSERLGYVGLEANSQGARDMGMLPDTLPGYVPVSDAKARAPMEKAWGVTLPAKPGKSYAQMLNDAGGSLKALYVMGANPASERPQWGENLDKVDFLVVQDLFLTETAQRADVVLPAVSWAETDGTFTNIERRVQRAVKAVQNPESRAAADWMILDHLAARLGADWPFADVRGVTAEIARLVPHYKGMTWDALGDQGAQWDAKQVRKSAAIQPIESLPAAAAGDGLDVVGGTVLYDAGTLFAATPQLATIAHGAHLGIHPDDAAKYGVQEGTLMAVRSDSGELLLAARFDNALRPGTIWIPESLPGQPLGALLGDAETVRVTLESWKIGEGVLR